MTADDPDALGRLLDATLGGGGEYVLADWLEEYAPGWEAVAAALRASEAVDPADGRQFTGFRWRPLTDRVFVWVTRLQPPGFGPVPAEAADLYLGVYRHPPDRPAQWLRRVPHGTLPKDVRRRLWVLFGVGDDPDKAG